MLETIKSDILIAYKRGGNTMKFLKRLSLLAISAVMALSMSACSSTSKEDEQKKFDAFIETQFKDSMQDYTTMHVFLEHPQDYGIDPEKVTVNLGERTDISNQKKVAEKKKKAWEEFKTFNRDKLTDEQKDIYDTFQYQEGITQKLSDEKFDYYEQFYASISGIHYQLPTLFSDWSLRNEQDVKDLITLMKDVHPYITSTLTYTKEQAKKGLLMTDMDSVKKYCEGIIKKGDKSAVLTSMNESIDALKLDAKKSEDYKKQLKEAFTSSFLPAYQDIYDTMKEIENKNNTEGLAKFEHGKEYYELLLQSSIGSNKSTDEIKTMMDQSYEKHVQTLQATVLKNADVLKTFTSGNFPKTKFKNYKEILNNNAKKLAKDFPSVADLKFNIKDINEEIASSNGVAAYFNTPAIDGTGVKQMRVNPKNSGANSIDTYSTVSHEGYPGHMYQYAFMYENVKNNYLKTCVNGNAYVEGYAVYAQYYAMENYLDGIDSDFLKAYKENELATYCVLINADIGIHYEGWDFDKFKQYINSKGFSLDDKGAKESYVQLQANPCAFEPYYVGYHEIVAIKENAMNKLGEKFDNKEFHTALLKSGNTPFSVVEKNMKDYIDKNK